MTEPSLPPSLPPAPHDNAERLQTLAGMCILDTAPEPGFDEVTRFIARVCETPVALVTLVDRDRQWFKSSVGVDTRETDLTRSVCAYVVHEGDFIEIEDLAKDPRTARNPLVTGPEALRFYAGAPLRMENGHVVGALCVLDTRPRRLSDFQRDTIRAMATQVVAQMDLKAALEKVEVLKKEVDHRVKNSLQSIASLVRMQARKAANPEVRAALTQVQARIDMVAALHQELYRSTTGNDVNLHVFGEQIVRSLSASSPDHVTIDLSCAPARVSAEQASAIGVILNEFATNSIKHAFPDGRAGTIRFDCIPDGEDRLDIAMTDDGVGFDAEAAGAAGGSGIGLAVIEASVSQLGGTWEREPRESGTAFRLSLPLRPVNGTDGREAEGHGVEGTGVEEAGAEGTGVEGTGADARRPDGNGAARQGA